MCTAKVDSIACFVSREGRVDWMIRAEVDRTHKLQSNKWKEKRVALPPGHGSCSRCGVTPPAIPVENRGGTVSLLMTVQGRIRLGAGRGSAPAVSGCILHSGVMPMG